MPWDAPDATCSARSATPAMFEAISRLPVAASVTRRVISDVVAVCSSTAAAIVPWIASISSTMRPIVEIASVAAALSLWIASMR